MPIYEYGCDDCGRITPRLVLNTAEAAPPPCKACASTQTHRIMSRFAYHRTEASRLAEFDPAASQPQDFYNDPRNIGLWAKKRAQNLGVDLGSQFEETVERARTGKILDDV